MDDQPICSIIVLIHLDEVVASAQRTNGTKDFILLDMPQAAQFFQFRLLRKPVWDRSDSPSGRDLLPNQLVQLLKLQPFRTEFQRRHAAPNIDTHQARGHPVPDGHSGSNGTALPGVDIGHDPNGAANGNRASAQ